MESLTKRPLRTIVQYRSKETEEESESLFLPSLTRESLQEIREPSRIRKSILLQAITSSHQNLLEKECLVPVIPPPTRIVLFSLPPNFQESSFTPLRIFEDYHFQTLEIPLRLNSTKTICRTLIKNNNFTNVEVNEVRAKMSDLVQSKPINITLKTLQIDEETKKEKISSFFSPYSLLLEESLTTPIPQLSLLAVLTTKLFNTKVISFSDIAKSKRFNNPELTKADTKAIKIQQLSEINFLEDTLLELEEPFVKLFTIQSLLKTTELMHKYH